MTVITPNNYEYELRMNESFRQKIHKLMGDYKISTYTGWGGLDQEVIISVNDVNKDGESINDLVSRIYIVGGTYDILPNLKRGGTHRLPISIKRRHVEHVLEVLLGYKVAVWSDGNYTMMQISNPNGEVEHWKCDDFPTFKFYTQTNKMELGHNCTRVLADEKALLKKEKRLGNIIVSRW